MDLRTEKDTLKRCLQNMFSLQEDAASHEEIRERLLGGGKITGTNMCVLICAMIIASVGLDTGSTAVIIGAMLISPLMGSIPVMASGTAANDGGPAAGRGSGSVSVCRPPRWFFCFHPSRSRRMRSRPVRRPLSLM